MRSGRRHQWIECIDGGFLNVGCVERLYVSSFVKDRFDLSCLSGDSALSAGRYTSRPIALAALRMLIEQIARGVIVLKAPTEEQVQKSLQEREAHGEEVKDPFGRAW